MANGGIPGIPGPYGGPDPGIPISQLPPLMLPVFGSEDIALVQNGVTYRATVAQIGGGRGVTLYYVATTGQTSFPLSTPDKFGNTFNLASAPALKIPVYRNGIRLALDDGSGYGGFQYDLPHNAVVLLQPAGAGEVITVDC